MRFITSRLELSLQNHKKNHTKSQNACLLYLLHLAERKLLDSIRTTPEIRSFQFFFFKITFENKPSLHAQIESCEETSEGSSDAKWNGLEGIVKTD